MITPFSHVRSLARACLLASGVLLAQAASVRADFLGVDISLGYLYNGNGTSIADRLPVDSLCYLIADVGHNGFSPLTASGWSAGDDFIVTVYDSQFTNGTKAFSLAAGTTEPGLFSRSLLIDLSQFSNLSTPIQFELVWFPEYKASQTNLNFGGPAAGADYGTFTRAVPLYSEYGTSPWFITNTPGANITVDPFATSELGGTDPAANGMANEVALVPEPSTALFGATALLGLGLRRHRVRMVAL